MRSTDFLTEQDYQPSGPCWTRNDGVDYWQPPLNSLATRNWKPTSRQVGRSSIAAITGTPTHVRTIKFESLLESKCATALLANRAIVNVVEQPRAVRYFNANEQKWLRHTFDLHATGIDGSTTAIAVRAQQRSEEVERIVEMIAEQGCELADSYALVTDADLPDALVENAELILAARRDLDRSADDKIRAIVETIIGAVTIETIVAVSGLEGKGFRAVVRLIDEGQLVIDQNVLIDFPAMVRRPHAIWAAA